MRVTHKFNFIDWKGDRHTGEVFRSHTGEYIPDSICGMGKNYLDAETGVADYLRRMGGTLKGALIPAAESRPINSQAIDYRVSVAMGYGQLFEPVDLIRAGSFEQATEHAALRYFGKALTETLAWQWMRLLPSATDGRMMRSAFTIDANGSYDKAFIFYAEIAS